MKLNFTIDEIKPKIFLFKFKNNYDACMHFVRYQEYYESDLPEIRNQYFTLIDFMELYSKKYGDGCFTYTRDWGGFNVPSWVFIESWNKGHYKDHNKYDDAMNYAYDLCSKKVKHDNFYIIGTASKSYIKHEVAHGFFYTSEDYKNEMTDLVNNLIIKKDRNKLFKNLKKMKYCKEVNIDECQAYLSTGTVRGFSKGVDTSNYETTFKKVFNKYYKK